MTIRYGARSLDAMRNREVEATSVETWATTLVATYETDPEAVAAVLPSPLRPPATGARARRLPASPARPRAR